jgi:uncharacterized membrane protein
MSTDTARLEAFSDGVFAVAITLLIFEVKAPAGGSGNLAGLLLRQWPSYLSFVTSFMFIGIMWINHHRLYAHIRRCDDLLLILNLLLLLGITFVPFPTSVLAEQLRGPDRRTAAVLFNATYLAIAILFNLLWRYAASARRQLLGADVNPAAVVRITRQYSIGPMSYLICVGLAYVSVLASLLLNLLLACFFLIPLGQKEMED